MVIVTKQGVTKEEIQQIVEALKKYGLGVNVSEGAERTVIGVIGDKTKLKDEHIELMTGVEKIVHIMESYKRAAKSFKPEPTVIDVKGVLVGGEEVVIMAGPCAVESREQIIAAAKAAKEGGAKIIRGGTYKPRTSPYAFQGLEEEGLKYLKEAGEITGLPVVTEVTNENAVDAAEKYVDMFQIGARNMQNFQLLKKVGQSKKPVLLKRGPSSTIEEWLLAAEYILNEGNPNVILCERGIRTYETSTRFTLDISAVPVAKSLTHLPVIVDPSHAAGKVKYVSALSLAAIAAGADGLIVEVHPEPKCALSDAAQQLTPEDFKILSKKVEQVANAVGRKF